MNYTSFHLPKTQEPYQLLWALLSQASRVVLKILIRVHHRFIRALLPELVEAREYFFVDLLIKL